MGSDVQLCEATETIVLQWHGCVRCNDYVFGAENAMLRCPKCGHPRFNQKKQPNEVFWYLPLKDQIGKLLQNKKYRELLMWETRRGKNSKYLCDVYDTPRWKQVAGEPTDHLTRIVYQICVDAFPWQSRKHAVFINYLLLIPTVINSNIFKLNSKSQPVINLNMSVCRDL